MHPSVRQYVAEQVQHYGLDRPGSSRIEIGSLDVNGGVRDLFTHGQHWGVDIRPGPGVDHVLPENYVAVTGWDHRRLFDVGLCVEMLEHDARPWWTFSGLGHQIRPGGFLILTTRGFMYGRHDHPSDYYRYSPEAIEVLLQDNGFSPLHIGPDTDPSSPGVFATAVR